jgi:hypothetical protein
MAEDRASTTQRVPNVPKPSLRLSEFKTYAPNFQGTSESEAATPTEGFVNMANWEGTARHNAASAIKHTRIKEAKKKVKGK